MIRIIFKNIGINFHKLVQNQNGYLSNNNDIRQLRDSNNKIVDTSNFIKNFDGFIVLGCVIRGKTPHFNYLSKSVIQSILDLSIYSKKPITNGIITCLNKKQANERSDSTKLNKGREAAKALLSLLKIIKDD